MLGAAVHVDEALRALLLSGTEESLARSIIEGQADLWPDESGECAAISFALVGSVVPASRAD